MSKKVRILFINIYMHQKNAAAFFKYPNIDLHIITDFSQIQRVNFEVYDCVYSPAILLDAARRFPKTRFIFGPHVSVFPDNRITGICGLSNVVYIQPSEWARIAWKLSPLCNGLQIRAVPFAIDVDKFCPVGEPAPRDDVFIYFKRRHPAELDALEQFLSVRGIKYRLFDYVKKYNEEDYLNFLKTRAKFGIWLGSHESQGFALQEALACNIPLLVWNATSMSQEYGGNLPDIPCTTIPYWDERCGEYFTMFYQLEDIFWRFIKNIENGGKYRPREYIMENLTVEKCEARFLDIAVAASKVNV